MWAVGLYLFPGAVAKKKKNTTTGWLLTAEIYSVTVLEAISLNEGVSRAPSEAPREPYAPLPRHPVAAGIPVATTLLSRPFCTWLPPVLHAPASYKDTLGIGPTQITQNDLIL